MGRTSRISRIIGVEIRVLVALFAVVAAPSCRSAAQTTTDSTYAKVLELDLERLPSPVPALYSIGYESRGTALQAGARHVRWLLTDSIDVEPSHIELIVLNEDDWERVTGRPYGLHTLIEAPNAFLVPAQVDRGIYHDDELPEAEAALQVDVIGLHYLAHFFSAEVLYPEGSVADPPVKWLDELFTLMLQDELLQGVAPELLRASRRFEEEALELVDPRVRTLEEFDREYRSYFVTQEGGANYAWFLARLSRWARSVRQIHGIEIMADAAGAVALSGADLNADEALDLLEGLGVNVGHWRRFEGNTDKASNGKPAYNERFPATLACGSLREHGAGQVEPSGLSSRGLTAPGERKAGATYEAECVKGTRAPLSPVPEQFCIRTVGTRHWPVGRVLARES